MGLTACGGDDDEGGDDGGGGGGGDVAITFLPKNLGNPYFDTSTAGAEKAAEEFGGTVDEVGPDAASPDAQVPFINTAAQQGVGALDRLGQRPRRRSATRSTRPATPAPRSSRSTPTPTPSAATCSSTRPRAEGIAKVQVDLIAEQIGDSGEIAILSAAANATNQNAWIEMMEDEPRGQPPGHRARRHRLRRRRRPEVVRQDRGAAAVPPEPQGHHLADHRRHRRRRPLPVRLGRTRARSR